jgi:hypothetical protein
VSNQHTAWHCNRTVPRVDLTLIRKNSPLVVTLGVYLSRMRVESTRRRAHSLYRTGVDSTRIGLFPITHTRVKWT